MNHPEHFYKTRYRVDYNTWVLLVPGGLLFRTQLPTEGGVALHFVPCGDTEAQNFIVGLEKVR